MKTRSTLRSGTTTANNSCPTTFGLTSVACEFISEDPVANGNRVTHIKSQTVMNAQYTTVRRHCGPFHYNPYDFQSIIMPQISPELNKLRRSLSWDKLPTSSQFGIIQFFAELDDTLAMFTKKFWTQLSYGSLTWGVLPFVNDVKSLFATVRNLSAGLSKIPYEDSSSQKVTKIGGAVAYDLELRVRKSGFASLDHVDDILLNFDRLGLHPDINTFWDLVPLSFMVDWFLPVGDLLEQLSPRGWVRSASFTGWSSVKITGTVSSTSTGESCIPAWPIKYYNRNYLESSLLDTIVSPKPELSLPSPKQLFNSLYILTKGGSALSKL